LVFVAALVLNAHRFTGLRSQVKAEDLDDFRARDVFIALEESFRAEDLNAEAILTRVEDEEVRLFIREASASGTFDVGADELIDDSIRMVERRLLERKRQRLILKIADLGNAASPIEIEALNGLMYEKKRLDSEWEAMKGERDERP
jgi:DNA primase